MTKNRKEALLQLLKEAQKPQNGKSLAEHFHVTRQIIVQDIAVLRAFSHIFFGSLGAFYLQKHPQTLDNKKSSLIFNFVLGLVHAIAEVLACVIFYASTGTDLKNMFYVLFVLVGFGTIIHSMVDYYLALAVYKALRKRH